MSLGYQSHPAADLFPLLEGDEFAALVADIEQRGLLEPILTTPDGTIIDGRNRWRACQSAGAPVRTVVYTGADPIGESISRNLNRRHLTASQRAMLALNILPLREAEARARQGERADRRPASTSAPRGAQVRLAVGDVERTAAAAVLSAAADRAGAAADLRQVLDAVGLP